MKIIRVNNDYMKIIKNKKHKKLLIIISIITVFLISIAAVYFYSQNINSKVSTPPNNSSKNKTDKVNVIDLNKPTTEEINAGNVVKKETVNNITPNEPSFNITISAANQNDNIMQIRTLIDTTISSGTCELIMKQGDKIVSKAADIQSLASTSTCKGFDIPISELSSGNWNLTISATSGAQTNTVSKDIQVQ